MLDTGQVIADRYELLKQLGRGGFSEVWLALDKLTDVKVAIKIYAPGMGLDDAGISLFTQEFSLVFDINHTNLLHPTYYDCWERMPYLILLPVESARQKAMVSVRHTVESCRF